MKLNLSVIILAAGESKRLGTPKQLLLQNGIPLIRRFAQLAVDLIPASVLVVTGAQHDQIVTLLQDLPVTCIYNAGWPEGMASSIRLGIRQLEKTPVDGALIMLCDQINVSSVILQQLVNTFETNKFSVVCSAYQGKLGTPAIFHPKFFSELLKLQGDHGAKRIIETCVEKGILSFEGGEIDIDSAADLDYLD